MARWKAQPTPLRSWLIQANDGTTHVVLAHFCFNNNDDGRGLVLRRYRNDNPEDSTEVVATFSTGYWQFYKEIPSDQV